MGDHVSIRYSSAPSFSYGSCYQNRDATPAQNFTNPVTHTLRYIMKRIQGRVPRLLMFGSGLESIPLIRLMIMGNNSPYKPTGLFPGKHGMNNNLKSLSCTSHADINNFCICLGVGAGICIKHKETSINLVTLYTATKYVFHVLSTDQ